MVDHNDKTITRKKAKKKINFASINEVLDLAHRLLPFQLYLKLGNACDQYVRENQT